MKRLQNAQKSLTDSLAVLESAVLNSQNSAKQMDQGDGKAAGLPTASPVVDLKHLANEVEAIEADLEKAIKMITDLTSQQLPGDSA